MVQIIKGATLSDTTTHYLFWATWFTLGTHSAPRTFPGTDVVFDGLGVATRGGVFAYLLAIPQTTGKGKTVVAYDTCRAVCAEQKP